MAPVEMGQRIKELEDLYLSGVSSSDGHAVSIETLLDILVVLYDECQGSSLCRERSISGFVSYGQCLSFTHSFTGISPIDLPPLGGGAVTVGTHGLKW